MVKKEEVFDVKAVFSALRDCFVQDLGVSSFVVESPAELVVDLGLSYVTARMVKDELLVLQTTLEDLRGEDDYEVVTGFVEELQAQVPEALREEISIEDEGWEVLARWRVAPGEDPGAALRAFVGWVRARG
jgi:tRNA A-37 threonylcarbamoyl transferase component Bud32